MPIPRFVRPVGEAINMDPAIDTGDTLVSYSRYHSQFYASGTMALQAALTTIKARFKSAESPKCMLAGYGCPDLISACIGAKIEPILLDCAPDTPFPSERSIESAAQEGCTGIILVNFLGIRPPNNLVDKCKQLGLFIIEDRAQSFLPPADTSHTLFGDAVVFSFGKGKPLSLLGGGMLLIKDDIPFQSLTDKADSSAFSRIKTQLSIFAYNLIIRPTLYPILLKLPGLSVGETCYHAPKRLKAMDATRLSILPKAIKHFDSLPRDTAQQALSQLNTALTLLGITSLIKPSDTYKMLRLPLLAVNKEMRDALVSQLEEQGIGATMLYQTSIPKVQDIPTDIKAQGSSEKLLKNACSFADRLFTLPCHSDVTQKDIETIKYTLESYICTKEKA